MIIIHMFLQYFEKWIITKECDPEKTLLENRINGLSNFFEAACIAGPWSADAAFDTKLSRSSHLQLGDGLMPSATALVTF